MGNSEIEQIEKDVKLAKQIAEFGAAVERLRTNKDFRKVVQEGYFEREPIRLVHLKADSNFQSPESQRSIVAQMDAIGAFGAFLNDAMRHGAIAAKQVEAGQAAIEEINAAEGNE